MPPRKASATLASADSPGKRQARKRELPGGDDESGSPGKQSQQPKRHRATHNPTPDGDDSTDEPPPVENGIVVNTNGGSAAEKEASPVIEAMTPSRRKPGRPKGSVNKNATTPSRSRAGVKWATPTTTRLMGMDTPSRRNLADRSARRKVARNLINRVVGDGVSDDDDDGAADEILAREIYSSDDDDDNDGSDGAGAGGDKSITAATTTIIAVPPGADDAPVAETPSKRRPGRPRGSGRGGARGGARGGRKRSPTPPRDLPAHELYLFQNKPGAAGKASSSNRLLSSTVELLTHDEYFTLLRNYTDPHADGALVAMEEGDGGFGGGGGGVDGDDDGDVDMLGAATAAAAEGPVVEYRIMYNKAAEEFICSSEMAFRTLLKEFHDHQIITSRKDPLGTELLCLPFRKDELESILEDLMS
ncbi:origin recognition complex subunit [Magnaporthiopsis poae ATCC 64411]|uniref:Origin recognition complex subunit n=1 Tax=Magnaporthiopsis poae (strain ATCC 64411 / 73-15) TaxID=644358 RepID=A0A0C4DVK0_MAGP6|nr:origin recognition complex subunit [Magnaporthiopsis poae ATCC 64411]